MRIWVIAQLMVLWAAAWILRVVFFRLHREAEKGPALLD